MSDQQPPEMPGQSPDHGQQDPPEVEGGYPAQPPYWHPQGMPQEANSNWLRWAIVAVVATTVLPIVIMVIVLVIMLLFPEME